MNKIDRTDVTLPDYGSFASIFENKKGEIENKKGETVAERTWGQWYKEASTNALFRHTFGRISCAIRVPIYAVATMFQLIKTVVKLPIAFLATPAYYIHKAICKDKTSKLLKAFKAYSFCGVAKDAITSASLLHKTLTSTVCILVAPPKKYYTILEGLKEVGEALGGKVHRIWNEEESPTLKQYFAMTLLRAVPYYSLITNGQFMAKWKSDILIGMIISSEYTKGEIEHTKGKISIALPSYIQAL